MFPYLHFRTYISVLTFPYLRFRTYVSVLTFTYLCFRTYVSVLTFPHLRFRSYLSVLTFPYLRFRTYVSVLTFAYLRFRAYVSVITFPYLRLVLRFLYLSFRTFDSVLTFPFFLILMFWYLCYRAYVSVLTFLYSRSLLSVKFRDHKMESNAKSRWIHFEKNAITVNQNNSGENLKSPNFVILCIEFWPLAFWIASQQSLANVLSLLAFLIHFFKKLNELYHHKTGKRPIVYCNSNMKGGLLLFFKMGPMHTVQKMHWINGKQSKAT